jgi:hypothetical protein
MNLEQAIQIANKYRNNYYNDIDSEKREVANAINVLLSQAIRKNNLYKELFELLGIRMTDIGISYGIIYSKKADSILLKIEKIEKQNQKKDIFDGLDIIKKGTIHDEDYTSTYELTNGGVENPPKQKPTVATKKPIKIGDRNEKI